MTDTTPKFSMLSAMVIIFSASILFGITIVVKKKRAANAPHPQNGGLSQLTKVVGYCRLSKGHYSLITISTIALRCE